MASIYRTLPIPIKSGVSNSLDNISNVITIPNNILQGDFAKAGINTWRFIINSTIGVLGLIDVASLMGFEKYEKEVINNFDKNSIKSIKKILIYIKKKINFSKIKKYLTPEKINLLLELSSNDPCWKLYKKNIDVNFLKKCLYEQN